MNESSNSPLATAVRRVVAVLACVYLVCAVPVLVLAALLLVQGETCQGRLFAMAVLVGVPAPLLLWLGSYPRPERVTLAAGAILGALTLLLLGLDYHLTPAGRSLPGAPMRSCFTGATAYQRASLANLVPEMDQLILASYVMPWLDPLMDRPNTEELRGQVRAIYGEMRQDPAFECLGSVFNLTYRDLFLGDRPVGHFYEYIPKVSARERLPVIVFLHGSLGNFKGYLWVWKRFADDNDVAIVAPSFGTGNWDAPGGEDAIEQARQYCVAHPRLDPSRIYLAGLSNGGRGVCLAARSRPESYRGLIFISPVLDTDLMLGPSFIAAWKDKPILVLHGSADNRIPRYYVNEAVAMLRGAGLRVEARSFEGQTHFLFFTIRDEVRATIGKWLRQEAL